MKYELLELKTPVIKSIGFGEIGNSAISYMGESNLKVGKLDSTAYQDPNGRRKDIDLLFLTASTKDNAALDELLKAAKIANTLNALTMAIVESDQGSVISELQGIVDSFIIFPKITGRSYNELFLETVQVIVDIITQVGIVNLDFSDLKDLTQNSGRCVIGSGVASGENKAQKAVEELLSSDLLRSVNFRTMDGILINISSACLSVDDFDGVLSPITKLVSDKAIIKVSTTINEELTDTVKVSILCAGIGN